MTWNLLHLARLLKDAGGVPAHGNQRTAWDAGARWYRCDVIGGGDQTRGYVDLPTETKGLLLGRPDDASALELAVDETLAGVKTADLGGTATTREVGDAVLARIG